MDEYRIWFRPPSQDTWAVVVGEAVIFGVLSLCFGALLLMKWWRDACVVCRLRKFPTPLRTAGKLEYAALMLGLGYMMQIVLVSDIHQFPEPIVMTELIICILGFYEGLLALAHACAAVGCNWRMGGKAVGYTLEATTLWLERRVFVL